MDILKWKRIWVKGNISNSPAFDGEPVVAVNPIRGAFGTSVIVVRYSLDGGITWSPIYLMPHIVSGFKSADPSLAFSEDGTLYLAYIDYSTD